MVQPYIPSEAQQEAALREFDSQQEVLSVSEIQSNIMDLLFEGMMKGERVDLALRVRGEEWIISASKNR